MNLATQYNHFAVINFLKLHPEIIH